MDYSIEEMLVAYAKNKELTIYSDLVDKQRNDYDFAQAGQIISGIEAGLSEDKLTLFASPVFDAMQMYWIRYGCERWDIKLVEHYAQPAFKAEQMREIVMSYEAGLDYANVSEYFTHDISVKAMAKRRYGLLLGNGYSAFSKTVFGTKRPLPHLQQQTAKPKNKSQEFSRDQLIILKKAQQAGINSEQLKVLANNKYEPAQMEQILWGFEKNKMTVEQVKIYASPMFRADQMTEMRKCLKEDMSEARVQTIADPRFEARQMMHMRLANDLSDEQFEFIAKPKVEAFKMGEYTLGFRQGYSIEDMRED